MWHVQMCFTISIHEIEPKASGLAICRMYNVMAGPLLPLQVLDVFLCCWLYQLSCTTPRFRSWIICVGYTVPFRLHPSPLQVLGVPVLVILTLLHHTHWRPETLMGTCWDVHSTTVLAEISSWSLWNIPEKFIKWNHWPPSLPWEVNSPYRSYSKELGVVYGEDNYCSCNDFKFRVDLIKTRRLFEISKGCQSNEA